MGFLTPIQPELRAYPVFDKLPKGCVMHPVAGVEAWPIFRPGEFVVVDTDQRDPVHGELFVIEFGRDSQNPHRKLVETFTRAFNFQRGEQTVEELGWLVGAFNRARKHGDMEERARRGQAIGWVDGPYATTGPNAGCLRDKLIGRVIGILEPSFDETALRRVN